jgi:hypothetical protein
MTFTPEDGTYEYNWEKPALKKPYLSVYPSLTETGEPLGPSIINTSKALFTIDIVINDIENASMLTLIQFALVYPTDLFILVPGVPYSATEGNFMNKPAWAPYGTDFFTVYGGIDTSGYETQYVVIATNPNSTTGNWDWGLFPDTAGYPDPADRVICTFEFEATVQEEYPWTAFVSGAFDLASMFRDMDPRPSDWWERMFLDANDEWIPREDEVDGDYYIQGWIMGLMIDVYTQYPDGFNGKGLNETSDMFEPQATVKLFAKLTYNGDPVQNKPVAFQVVGAGTCEDPENTTGYVNFTRIAMTDEDGVAYIEFGIPWPCNASECEEIFGVWTVVAKATVREATTEDWLWFKVNWLVMNLTVTPDAPGAFKKGEDASFTVTFCTWKLQPEYVLITLTIYDDLGVPVGTSQLWVLVGDEDIVWCTSKCYEENFTIPLPKWAFAGEGTIYVNALTDWPFNCGVPVCPEEKATFVIIKYTT